ncbi:HAMP domain-containing histidine kinase [Bowmanella sp. Y26]|uniref:sensor histidine kinase n=1 Tax=Bowmanella yangjiangensis TaxID=2811230 RepID=UPI001BDDA1C3|nr:HAMP domain-containing sensor histidine kinase [Bowmanella yangjiangensis]MBT1063672.1 HAMP domain-containing histidine kinase [Bowmanella yangjiangensis]
MQRHSVKYRLLFSIGLVTCLTALLFGVVSFLFAYHVEDKFFERVLDDEAMRLNQRPGAEPHLPFITLYSDAQQLPKALQLILRAEPERKEIGLDDGRHFHLKQLDDGRLLLAEVSDYLVVRSIKGEMLTFLLLCLSLVLVLSISLALSIANRLLKPLSRLTQTIENTTEAGLPKGFANAYPNNEIGIMAHALDAQMQRINAFIQREQQFTRDISHELRTPLTVFDGALTLLKETALQPRQQELLNRLEDNKIRMQQCLAGLLALAREENLQYQNVRLQNALEHALLPYLDALAQERLSLKIDHKFEVSIPPVVLDIILSNLINNAISHGHGALVIHQEDQSLSIFNQGPAISGELQPNLFEPGIKGEQSQGLGLGLSIVKRLCDHYQIAISCQSDHEGTCFRLTFATLTV